MMNKRNPKNVYNYKMSDRRGRVVKYGITKNPFERALENIQDGLGSFLEVTGGPVTRRTDRTPTRTCQNQMVPIAIRSKTTRQQA